MGYICYSCVHRSDCADADFQTGICEHYKHKPAENASGVRLIDANALIKALLNHERTENEIKYHCLSDENVIALIQNAPTVEQKYYERVIAQINPVIEARPQGEWIRMAFDDKTIFYCSECHSHFEYPFNFCPNCGADMRGGAE